MERYEQLLEDIQTSSRIVDEWAMLQLKSMQEASARHHKVIEDDKENITKLQQSIKSVDEQKLQQLKVSQKQQNDIQIVKAEIEDFVRQKDHSLTKQEILQNQVLALEQEIKRETEALNLRQKEVALKMKEYSKGVSFYCERLGLRFERTGQDNLKFIFKNVDPDNLNREFSFSIYLDSDNKYHVDTCQPMVEGLASMVSKLNIDNSLSGFVKDIRKKFKLTL